MFRALVIGLGSLSVIALFILGIRQIDLDVAGARIGQVFGASEDRSPLLRQAEAEAQFVRQDALAKEIADLSAAIQAERRARTALEGRLATLDTDRATDTARLTALSEAVNRLETQLTGLPAQVPALTGSSDSATSARLDHLDRQILVLSGVLDTRDVTLRDLQRQIQSLQTSLGGVVQRDPNLGDAQERLAKRVDTLRRDLSALQSQLTVLTTPTVAISQAAPAAPALLDQTPGWVVSLHPTSGLPPKQVQSPLLGRMVLSSYAFTMGVHSDKFPTDTNLGYRGSAHLNVPQSGTYVFTVFASGEKLEHRNTRAYCAYALSIGGQEVFDTPNFRMNFEDNSLGTAEITLQAGEHDVMSYHYCAHQHTGEIQPIKFDLHMLPPGALNAGPIPEGALYHRLP